MHARKHVGTLGCSILAAAIATAAVAYDPVVLARGWQRVASDEAGSCRGEVGSNGQFYVLSVAGLEPGERSRLRIESGDMKPIDHPVRANARGEWQRYYIPFRPNQGEAGTVSAQVTAADCALALQFSWKRRKGWEEPAPLRNPFAR